MRLISDEDKGRIERAFEFCKFDMPSSAEPLLSNVLANIKRLEVEQPNPEPRLAPISEAELRKIYPERYPIVVPKLSDEQRAVILADAERPAKMMLAALCASTLRAMADDAPLPARCQCRGLSLTFDYHTPDECGIMASRNRALYERSFPERLADALEAGAAKPINTEPGTAQRYSCYRVGDEVGMVEDPNGAWMPAPSIKV